MRGRWGERRGSTRVRTGAGRAWGHCKRGGEVRWNCGAHARRLGGKGIEARLYPVDGKRHVLARLGALTAKLRRGWGQDKLKKDAEGKRREDDRHHALDAIVVTACDESTLNSLTVAFRQSEQRGAARDFLNLDQPWPGFRAEVEFAERRRTA